MEEARINYNKDMEMWRVKFKRCTVLFLEIEINCPCKTIIEDGSAYILVKYNKVSHPTLKAVFE